MKKLMLFLLLAMSMPLFAQTTTYTTIHDACGGKSGQMCQIPVVDSNNVGGFITIDNRAPSRTGYLDLGPFGVNEYHGAYHYPTQAAHTPYYGVATYVSDDQTVVGHFNVYAWYVSTCSGRGCGGTLGWHYRILGGSKVKHYRQ